MSRILEKRFIRLLNERNIEKLHEYFNITHAKISLLDLNTVEIKYVKFNKQNMSGLAVLKKSKTHNLPEELIDEIAEYIPTHSYLYLTLNVDYLKDYPFKPPIWSLHKTITNITNKNNEINRYFENIIGLHNKSYWKDWSPAIYIDADIMTVFLKIDKFDNLETSLTSLHS